MESRLKRIYNYFETVKGKGVQLLKLLEEIGELSLATIKYIANPTNENFEEIIKEYADVTVVLKQIILKRGMTLEYFDSMVRHYEVIARQRTIELIDKAEKEGKSYDEVRDELRRKKV